MPLGSVGSLYEAAIVETGRQPELFFFCAFLASFGFIRTSTHLIRAQVRWWPGNISVGGTHIHHMFWGILLLLVVGYVAVAIAPPSPWREVCAVLFGIGAGLTMDEYALWLNLEDVYWSEKGRRSIDAVIVCAVVSGLMVLGFGAWVEVADEVATEVFALVGVVGLSGVALAIVCAAKERFWLAAAALVLAPVGLIGALRLAKPRSVWARLFYGEKRLARARERYGEAGGEAAATKPAAGAAAPAAEESGAPR